MIYDTIIIGAGPAGMTAAIYCARFKMKLLLIAKDIGGQVLWTSTIENYPPFTKISGAELIEKFNEHIAANGIDVVMENITGIEKSNSTFKVMTDKNAYETKTIIIASGKKPRPLNVPGEKEFLDKGVTYCATCDAPLYHNKTAAVIGGGNSAMDAALQLMPIAKKVYLININPALKGDKIMMEKIQKAKNITIMNNTKTLEITGQNYVTGIKVSQNGKEQLLKVDGVFVEIGMIPNSDFAGIVEKNQQNELKIDKNCMTNIPGIFAAGDVTDVPVKQMIVAAGEGAKAAVMTAEWLQKNKN